MGWVPRFVSYAGLRFIFSSAASVSILEKFWQFLRHFGNQFSGHIRPNFGDFTGVLMRIMGKIISYGQF